jgi:hypothetical protein
VKVELAELISQLRSELTEAMREGQDSELRFELGPVELELSVGVDRETKPGGKVKFWVLELGAEKSTTTSSTQRISLTLDPRRASRPGSKALISGDEVPGER